MHMCNKYRQNARTTLWVMHTTAHHPTVKTAQHKTGIESGYHSSAISKTPGNLIAMAIHLAIPFMHRCTCCSHCMQMAEGPGRQAMGYILGKAEGQGELWHGHVTAVTVAPDFRWGCGGVPCLRVFVTSL